MNKTHRIPLTALLVIAALGLRAQDKQDMFNPVRYSVT